jgi:ring-1,2-phenylacetyl-CoA epoxidase subunit PaaA
MMTDEKTLIDRIAAGEKIQRGTELSVGYRSELMRLMVIFTDSEMAGAAGFADVINRGSGLKERMIAARIVSEKLHHAETVLELLEDFGVNPALYVNSHPWTARLDRDAELGSRRIGGDKRLNVFYYPLEGWTDTVVMNMLMGSATTVQIGELQHCSYQPLAECMVPIVKREAEHAELGERGVRVTIERQGSTLAAQASVNYWYSRVAATFGRIDSDRVELYRRYGLRQHSNSELLQTWEGIIHDRLQRLGLQVPTPT